MIAIFGWLNPIGCYGGAQEPFRQLINRSRGSTTLRPRRLPLVLQSNSISVLATFISPVSDASQLEENYSGC